MAQKVLDILNDCSRVVSAFLVGYLDFRIDFMGTTQSFHLPRTSLVSVSKITLLDGKILILWGYHILTFPDFKNINYVLQNPPPPK